MNFALHMLLFLTLAITCCSCENRVQTAGGTITKKEEKVESAPSSTTQPGSNDGSGVNDGIGGSNGMEHFADTVAVH